MCIRDSCRRDPNGPSGEGRGSSGSGLSPGLQKFLPYRAGNRSGWRLDLTKPCLILTNTLTSLTLEQLQGIECGHSRNIYHLVRRHVLYEKEIFCDRSTFHGIGSRKRHDFLRSRICKNLSGNQISVGFWRLLHQQLGKL